MTNYITIKDGDILAGYKEYYLNSMLSVAFWRTTYPSLWVDAGGSEIVLDGRTYFGGLINVDNVSSAADKLLRFSGLDDAGISDIKDAYSQDGVNHVYMQLSPHQTYTLDGLKWFFTNIVKPTIQNSGVSQFSISYEGPLDFEQVVPVPYSFKVSPSSDHTPIGTTPLLFDEEINSVIELIYRLTDWFEEFEDVSTSVTGVEVSSGIWKYTTTSVITLSDLSYFSDSAKMQELYDLIHLGDSAENYYRTQSNSSTGFVELDIANNAGILWSFEYGYDGASGVYATEFTDREGLVIYYDGRYWIDTELWKTSHPLLCLVTLGRLIDIGIDKANVPFWKQFLGFIAGFFNAVITILGESVYAVFWVGGLFVLDIAAHNGWISKKDLKQFKKISKLVMGRVTFAVITYGASEKITAFDVLLYALDAATLSVEVYNMTLVAEIEKYNVVQEVEDDEDGISAVYDDSNVDLLDVSEFFHEYAYELLDPWIGMED